MYLFTTINNIDDVLPAYDPEFFTRTEQNGLIFFNYRVMRPETFPPVVDYNTATRREFRGLAFYADTGKVASRPFHKFFNLGERPEEQWDFKQSHVVEEKLDGSMIRPLFVDDHVRLGTKAGITDVAMQAEEFIADKQNYVDFMWTCFHSNVTPIFEFTSPENRIVLEYDKPELTLLAIRGNTKGSYLVREDLEFLSDVHMIPLVKPSGYVVDKVKDAVDDEGIVIAFRSGHKIKVKSDWYVKLHYGKEVFKNERKVVKRILDNDFDDVLAALGDEDFRKATAYECDLFDAIDLFADKIEKMYDSLRDRYETKKDFALDSYTMPPFNRHLMFTLWDGKYEDAYVAVLDNLKKRIGTAAEYEKTKDIMRLPTL